MAEAAASRTKAKTAPKFIKGPRATIPSEAKAEGAQGKVVVSGIIGIDGQFGSLSVKESSKSDWLDNAAVRVASASKFVPAKDAAGQPIAIVVNMPFEFSNTTAPEGNGVGIIRYRCDQFVRDSDWWSKTWPGRIDNFRAFVSGYSIIARSQTESGTTEERYGKAFRDDGFGARWQAAIAACRNAPDKLMVDMLEQEGEMLKSMAARFKRR